MEKTTPTILVIYHANCPDGFAAAWVCWRSLGDNADYLPMNYYQDPPAISAYDKIYIVDFSLKRDVLLNWVNQGKDVTVLDHHQTAQKDLEDLPCATFDMTKCGAVLAWEEFNSPRLVMPDILLYVQDRDLWKWELPGSREINAALSQYTRGAKADDEGFAIYEDVMYDPRRLVEEGKTILRCQQILVEAMGHHLQIIEIAGHRVPVVNAACLSSEVCEYLYNKHTDAPFVASYMDLADKRVWALRTNKPDVDVSAIAKRYGGGGHKAAAGFSTTLPQVFVGE